MSTDGVPNAVAAHLTDLLPRAAAAGHPLEPVPRVQLRPDKSSTHSLPGTDGRPGVLVLSSDVLAAPPDVQRWALAHELAHLLPPAAGTRLRLGAGPAVVAVLAAVVALTAAVTSAWQLATAATLGPAAAAAWLLAPAGVVVMWAAAARARRRHEDAVDAAAARVFGQVLPEDGVAWLTRTEGTLPRLIPGWLRTHSRPTRRRRTGLRAATD